MNKIGGKFVADFLFFMGIFCVFYIKNAIFSPLYRGYARALRPRYDVSNEPLIFNCHSEPLAARESPCFTVTPLKIHSGLRPRYDIIERALWKKWTLGFALGNNKKGIAGYAEPPW